MTETLTRVDSWAPQALCSHYCSAHVDEQRVQVQGGGGSSVELTVIWAAGVLSDGNWEALGAWPGAAAGPAFWQGVWEELDSRGVDKISLVCAADLDARALCTGVTVLPPFCRILGQGYVPAASGVGRLRAEARRAVREASGVRAARIALERLLARVAAGRALLLSPDWPEVLEQLRPFYALRPHRRVLVRAGDEYLEQLGGSLTRAVARHGPFADLAAAVSFVGQTISREELRLKSLTRVEVARPRLRWVGSDAAGLVSLGHGPLGGSP